MLRITYYEYLNGPDHHRHFNSFGELREWLERAYFRKYPDRYRRPKELSGKLGAMLKSDIEEIEMLGVVGCFGKGYEWIVENMRHFRRLSDDFRNLNYNRHFYFRKGSLIIVRTVNSLGSMSDNPTGRDFSIVVHWCYMHVSDLPYVETGGFKDLGE